MGFKEPPAMAVKIWRNEKSSSTLGSNTSLFEYIFLFFLSSVEYSLLIFLIHCLT